MPLQSPYQRVSPLGKRIHVAFPSFEEKIMRTFPKTVLGASMLLGAMMVGFTTTAPEAKAAGCPGGSQVCETVEVCVGVLVQVCATKYFYQRPMPE